LKILNFYHLKSYELSSPDIENAGRSDHCYGLL
jgi:hypothetical protein